MIRKRPQFKKLAKAIDEMFPNGLKGMINRLEKFNVGGDSSQAAMSTNQVCKEINENWKNLKIQGLNKDLNKSFDAMSSALQIRKKKD